MKGSFNVYVDRIWIFFDHLLTSQLIGRLFSQSQKINKRRAMFIPDSRVTQNTVGMGGFIFSVFDFD